jgi:hypothetical protein
VTAGRKVACVHEPTGRFFTSIKAAASTEAMVGYIAVYARVTRGIKGWRRATAEEEAAGKVLAGPPAGGLPPRPEGA